MYFGGDFFIKNQFGITYRTAHSDFSGGQFFVVVILFKQTQ
jgi:hypothetical protein